MTLLENRKNAKMFTHLRIFLASKLVLANFLPIGFERYPTRQFVKYLKNI